MLRIEKVSVTGLFGIFNHEIPMKVKERITIIHGPNGFGKTVLLRMVDNLCAGRWAIFQRIPFENFRIDFIDGTYISVRKSDNDETKKSKLSISISGETDPLIVPHNKFMRDSEFPYNVIDSIIPELDRVGPQEWRNLRMGEILGIDDVIERYGDVIEARTGGKFQAIRSEALKNITNKIKTHFIKTERLRTKIFSEIEKYATRKITEENNTSAIVEYSRDLSRRIQETLAKSVEYSSSLDRSFPKRLVENITRQQKSKLTETSIRNELSELEAKRARLMTAGLLDKDQENFELPEQTVDDLTKLVLSIYVNDVRDKLAVFDEDLKKIELFRDILSKRFGYKNFSISKEKGFIFTALDGSELPLDALSSGEQHETVLIYELLFRVKENSLILIDEPEISLHIAWQQEFLKDLSAITELSGFDILIATHSPDIINDRWDLTVGLEGPKQ